ncbi:MAG: hypothetical protein Q8M07_03895 [Prosthecobacter sp.]|nr:hypothetical protein [Prosthecobacter sp.]
MTKTFTTNSSNANPAYAARNERGALYVKLPQAPVTASPVPGLTSLYYHDSKEKYGDRRYPGNCGGELIRDLITFFAARNVLDPMAGSGTCGEVCRDIGVPCISLDIRHGFDATNPESFANHLAGQKFDLIWAHPPYWKQKLYTSNERDLSRATTLAEFLELYTSFMRNCADVLTPKGKLVILMGDHFDRLAGFIPLTHYTRQIAFGSGLRQHCTDIIRFRHGASSRKTIYPTSFIPALHDTCMVFER